MPLTLRFEDKACAALEQTGGKGASLARMTQEGFAVPPGFVVVADTYRAFMRGFEGLEGALAGFAYDDPARLRDQAEALRTQLAARPLPEALQEELRAQLAAFPGSQAFSVRSSSTLEDLAGAAFAGQHDTFLNVTGEVEILRRIRDCFLSLWMDRAIAYRHERGFDHHRAAMAVVVQRMVRCDVAGVGFSVNPIQGHLGEMILNANYGLGESVVSGEGEVDQWIVDKATLAVKEAVIARKHAKIVCAEQGTEEVLLSDTDAEAPCLSEPQLRALSELLVAVERSCRFPQDIEWGIEAGALFLLQARPITSIPPKWTRDESAERFPTVITPLTWDFVQSGFHRSLEHSLKLMDMPPFEGLWFGMHGHYIYGNQNAVHLYLGRSPLEVKGLDDLRARIPTLRRDFPWVLELPAQWSRDLDHYLLSIGRLMAEPLGSKNLAEVWDFVLEVQELGAQYFLPNIAISITHGSLYRFLFGFLAMAVGRAQAPILFDALLASCDTKTSVINRELWQMARQIEAEPVLAKLIQETPSRQLVSNRLLEAHPGFQARFETFLRDHGHREVEFDAYHATWVEAPWVVLDNLRLLLAGPLDEDPAEREAALKRSMFHTEAELMDKVPADLHFFLSEILRLARLYTSLDDLEHYQTTRLTLPLRRGLRELGARLVVQGVLKEPMDVFFAHRDALEQAVRHEDADTWAALSEAVYAEKAAYLQHRDEKPAWILGEAPAPLSTGDHFKGLPGSPGTAEGEVHLVRSSEDFATFPKGAVLVARTTNPTWTPLFYRASAVVTESGGPLSHGAVTAREMKIPAVMSVRDCLSLLENGQRVRVRGAEGVVERIG